MHYFVSVSSNLNKWIENRRYGEIQVVQKLHQRTVSPVMLLNLCDTPSMRHLQELTSHELSLVGILHQDVTQSMIGLFFRFSS